MFVNKRSSFFNLSLVVSTTSRLIFFKIWRELVNVSFALLIGIKLFGWEVNSVANWFSFILCFILCKIAQFVFYNFLEFFVTLFFHFSVGCEALTDMRGFGMVIFSLGLDKYRTIIVIFIVKGKRDDQQVHIRIEFIKLL